jgi:ornithine cyclodeaminase/alanine dehydrogenase-like protein (mu-crystallin family)
VNRSTLSNKGAVTISHTVLFLSDQEVERFLGNDMDGVIECVARVLSLLDRGDANNAGKCVLRWGQTPEEENIYGRINAMPGYIGGEFEMAGLKWIGSGPMNYKKGLPRASSLVILNDPNTKLPVCIANGTEVSAKRTGAKSGLAVRYLAAREARVLTIMGAGVQGRSQLNAILRVRPDIEQVYVYDIRPEASARYAKEMGARFGVRITPTDDREKACRNSDIIATATLATEPIVEASWIKKGCLMINLADFEFSYDCVRMADKIVVDDWTAIKHRMISTATHGIETGDVLIHYYHEIRLLSCGATLVIVGGCSACARR